MNGIRRQTVLRCLWMVLFFAAAALVMTYPMALHLTDGVSHLGDPLVDIWILSSVSHKVLALDFRQFFEANILWPSPFAGTYNDHLLGWLPLVLPAYLVSGNMVLAYNVALLASVVLAEYFMYLLARHLTGSEGGGLFAGLAFAFVPFRVQHWSHLNLWGYFWAPLALLCLHRLIGYGVWGVGHGRRGAVQQQGGSGISDQPSAISNQESAAGNSRSEIQNLKSEIQHLRSPRPQTPDPKPQIRWGVAAGAVVALQLMTSLYVGVFLCLMAAFFVLFLVPVSGAWRRGRFWLAGAAGAAVLAGGTLWTILPYVHAHRTLGFEPSPDEVSRFSAAMSDYFTAPPRMRTLARMGVPLQGGETAAWLGVAVVVLAAVGLATWLRRRGEPARGSAVRRGLSLALLLTALIPAVLLAVGGWELARLAGLGVPPAYRPLALVILALIAAAAVVGAPRGHLGRLARRWFSVPMFYASAAVVFWLLSLGPTMHVRPGQVLGPGPFRLLATVLPGVRTPCRMSLMVSLCVTVLAALGVAFVLRRLKSRAGRAAFAAAACLVVGVEFWSAPAPVESLRLSNDTRALCRWLADQDDAAPIIHFPLTAVDAARDEPAWRQAYYMYLSAFHRRPIVNPLGYARFETALHRYVRPIVARFPDRAAIDALQALDVRWVVLHRDQTWGVVPSAEACIDLRLTVRKEFGPIAVVEVAVGPFHRPNVRSAPPAERELIAFLRLLTMAEDPGAIEEIGRGLVGVSMRLADRDRAVDLAQGTLSRVGAPGRLALVRVLYNLRTAAAAEVLADLASDASPEVRRLVAQSLAQWQDPAAAGAVLRVAALAADPADRVRLIAAYCRLVRADPARSPGQQVRAHLDAVTFARDDDDRRTIVSGLGYVHDLSALRALAPFLSDAAVRERAAGAIAKVAPAVYSRHPAEARAALDAALLAAQHPEVRKSVRQTLDALPK
jgi:hypothetical protein